MLPVPRRCPRSRTSYGKKANQGGCKCNQRVVKLEAWDKGRCMFKLISVIKVRHTSPPGENLVSFILKRYLYRTKGRGRDGFGQIFGAVVFPLAPRVCYHYANI